MTKFVPHFHTVVGVNIIFEITTVPPFVIPTPEPIATVSKPTEDNHFKGHEHEQISTPSLEISESFQQMVGNFFMSHTHTEETIGVSILPPGPTTGFCTYLPPPLDILPSDFRQNALAIHKQQINMYLKEFNKYKNSTNNILLNNKNIILANYKNFVINYVKNLTFYDKFKNNR